MSKRKSRVSFVNIVAYFLYGGGDPEMMIWQLLFSRFQESLPYACMH